MLQTTTKIKGVLYSLIFPISIILIWYFAVFYKWVPTSLSASPLDIVKKLIELFSSWIFPKQIFFSLFRLLAGLMIGCFIGIGTAFINTSYKKVDQFLSPTLNFFAPIPIVIWIPFFIMIFGTADYYKIGLIGISTFFLIYINLYTTYGSINKQYTEIGLIYQKGLIECFRKILFPYGLESLFTTLRLCIAIGWIVIYVTEYGNSTQNEGGLGYFIGYNKAMGNVENQFAGVVVLAALSFIMDSAVVKIQHHYLKWKNKKDN